MSQRVLVLLPKDPTVDRGGDLALIDVLTSIARALGHTVRQVCLSTRFDELGSDADITRVAKPPVSARAIAGRSVRTGHSLVHSRYDLDSLVAALDTVAANSERPQIVIAEHSYMAESYLRSRLAGCTRLLVNTSVLESSVWAHRVGLFGRIEAHRIRADERRIMRAAAAVATYDRWEVPDLVRAGAARSTWLDLTLPPGVPAAVRESPPRLMFLGDRRWAPNKQAVEVLVRWWPEIRKGIPGAELVLVGRCDPRSAIRGDTSVVDLGFVADVDEVMSTCRALVAPVLVGGGVRVKVLHAVARGLPVVTTRVGAGSLTDVFGLPTHDGRDQFVARCRELLQRPDLAAVAGQRCYAANAAHWATGRPVATFAEWLAA